MTLIEGATIIVGLFAGYWVVGKLLFRSPPPPRAPNESESSSPPPEWPHVLQVSTMATVEDIRTAYRHLISQYHPDKVDQLGPELKELAARKSQEITVAYQQAMRARGLRE